MNFNHEWLNDILRNCDQIPHRAESVPGESHQIYIPKLCGLAESMKYTVRFQCVPVPNAIGLCHTKPFGTGGDIYVDTKLCETVNNQFRTLIHETAHALGADTYDEPTDEVTAESVAFEVSRELGLDTSCWSHPYVLAFNSQGARLSVGQIEAYTAEILSYL